MMNIKKYLLPVTTSLIAILTLSGCALFNKGEYLDSKNVNIVRVDSNHATIGVVNITRGDQKTWIRGDIRRRLSTRAPILGHLHINVKMPDGRSVFNDTVDYKRKSVKARTAQYYVTVNTPIEDGSTIFIKHHTANSD